MENSFPISQGNQIFPVPTISDVVAVNVNIQMYSVKEVLNVKLLKYAYILLFIVLPSFEVLLETPQNHYYVDDNEFTVTITAK